MNIDSSRRSVLLAVIFALALIASGCGRGPRTKMVVLLNRVWQVQAQGQIAPVHYRVAKNHDDGVQSWPPPLPSPDGRWITFGNAAEDFDVHLLDVYTLRGRRITWLGQPPRLGYSFAVAQAAGWSANSRRILISVTPGEVDSDEGQYDIPKITYGFYIYDLTSNRVSFVALPKQFDFVAWLPDGRLLGLVPGPSPCESKLVTFSVRDGRESQIGPPLVNAGQMKASPDYQWVFGVLGIGECKDSQDQEIAKINLRTGKATVLIPSAPWAANQWPALSPDRQHFSYMHQSGLVNGVPQMSLFVDNRRIYFCPGLMDYQWAGNRHIALACIKSQRPLAGDVMTLDVNTGKTLFRRGL